MSFKKSFIFLAIFVLLGGYYYIVEVRLAGKKQAAEQAEKKLFQANKEEIQELALKRADQEIVLKKQENVWKMTQPVAALTDAQNVESLLASFVEAERSQTIAEQSSNDAEFGFDQPELVIAAKTQDQQQTFQLALGQKTPTTAEYYARVEGTPAVITVSESVKTALNKTMYDLRDKTILDFDPAQVKQVVFTLANPDTGTSQEIKLEQRDDLWKIVAPKEYAADKTLIGSLLSKVKISKIKAFIEETPQVLKQYGLDQPKSSLTLVIGDDNTQKTLLLGNTDATKGGVYAKYAAADNVFLVPTDLVEQLPKQPNDLRDKTLLAFQADAIQKIELQTSGETVLLERTAPEPSGASDAQPIWKIGQPAEFPADQSKVQDLLADISDLKVEQFVTDDPTDLALYGLEPPQVTVKLWAQDQEQPYQLLLGNNDVEKTGVYAKPGDQPSLVLVKSEALGKLKKTAFDLRYRKFLSVISEQVTEIQIAYPDKTLLLQKDGDLWKAKEPETKELLSYKVNNLLYDLANLEFQEEILPPAADLSVYGLSDPAVTITLQTNDAQPAVKLRIGKNPDDPTSLYAKTAEGATVYAIDPAVFEALPKDVNALAE